MNGGGWISEVLHKQGVRHLFTLCGGHISPILVEAKRRGIGVVDVRHEVTAVFAADATARLTGVPGVAAVTAGPGVTNTLTALQNARLAQSPVVLLGGATATVLRGRGSLQDIDQRLLLAPVVKWQASAKKVRDLVPLLEEAFFRAQEGVPGPVFLECPVDLLYDEPLVRSWYGGKTEKKPTGFSDAALRWYLNRHLDSIFERSQDSVPLVAVDASVPQPEMGASGTTSILINRSERPVLILGSGAMQEPGRVAELRQAIKSLKLPVYLSGMGRGLLGLDSELQLRHKRKEALREADLVILAGTPCDFRLDYGRNIGKNAVLIAVNRDKASLTLNRRPALAVLGDPGRFLVALADSELDGFARPGWLSRLRQRDAERDEEIWSEGKEAGGSGLDAVEVCRQIEQTLPDNGLIVADGGDFVATASYIVRPRSALSWLDPGVFGTLGVGAGFATAAALHRPDATVLLLWGDGSAGYGLSEIDTFVRHQLPVVAVVGNDASWSQIAREQVEVLKDSVGTDLLQTDYHRVAEGFGGIGILAKDRGTLRAILQRAFTESRSEKRPVLVNVHLGRSAFRKGSISM
jgi:acetolactate synthase-1/2/3 large subunit